MWIVIRKATIEEEREWRRRAERFAEYHHAWRNDGKWCLGSYGNYNTDNKRQIAYLHILWHKIIQRITKESRAWDIQFGYVGYHRRDA